MRVSFTGTRKGFNEKQALELRTWLIKNRPVFASHGCCEGSDIQFHKMLREIFGKWVYIAVYPSTASTAAPIPEDANYVAPREEPLKRNPDIIDAGKDVLLATPLEMEMTIRSGTWHAIRYPKRSRVPVEIFYRE